jgi:predicted short-subunit dehydrogenase-like oxidoreductase (DUF2520 family)
MTLCEWNTGFSRRHKCCYPRPVPVKRTKTKPSITIVGPGNLGSALATELYRAGYTIPAIVRRAGLKITGPKALAHRVKADLFILGERSLDSDIVWLTVPDDAITAVAAQLAASQSWKGKIVFHSSGALTSEELAPLWEKGAHVASVHPMMTFVAGQKPSWRGVSFAVEGDDDAVRLANQIATDIGGRPFEIDRRSKVLYHAFGSFASPLVIALMSAMEQVAEAAGIPTDKAKNMMRPLLAETLNNYLRSDAASAFSGPLVRGDVHTIRKHLAHLQRIPEAREVYVALAKSAIERLPVKNKKELKKELSKAGG